MNFVAFLSIFLAGWRVSASFVEPASWGDIESIADTSQLRDVEMTPDGWRNFVPSHDTRIVYVSSSSGNDGNDGISESTPVQTLHHALTLLRDGYPDWLLLKRGDTFYEWIHWSLSGRSYKEMAVIGSYGEDARPPTIASGTNAGFVIYWDQASTGSSPSNIAIVGIRFHAHENDHYMRVADGSIAIPEVHAYDDITYHAENLVGLNIVGATKNLWIEDCTIHEYGTGIEVQSLKPSPDSEWCFPNCLTVPFDMNVNITIRRSRIFDNYVNPCGPDFEDFPCSDGVDEGMLLDCIDGLIVEDTLIDRNQWHPGTADLGIFDKAMYLTQCQQTVAEKVVFRRNILSRSQDVDGRPGGNYMNNLFVGMRMGLNAGIVQCCETYLGGVYARVTHNVFLDGPEIIGSRPGGIGVDLANIDPSRGQIHAYNIFAHGTGMPAFQVEPYNDPGVGIHNLTIRDNIVYDWGPIRFMDNPTCAAAQLPCNNGTQEQVKAPRSDIAVRDNKFLSYGCNECCSSACRMIVVEKNHIDPQRVWTVTSPTEIDAYTFSDNEYFSNHQCAHDWFRVSNETLDQYHALPMATTEWKRIFGDTSVLPEVPPEVSRINRSMAAYCLETGVCDGNLEAFADAARNQSKGTGFTLSGTVPALESTWDERLTAAAVNDWVRKGFSALIDHPKLPTSSSDLDTVQDENEVLDICEDSLVGGSGDCKQLGREDFDLCMVENACDGVENLWECKKRCLLFSIPMDPFWSCVNSCHEDGGFDCEASCAETIETMCFPECVSHGLGNHSICGGACENKMARCIARKLNRHKCKRIKSKARCSERTDCTYLKTERKCVSANSKAAHCYALGRIKCKRDSKCKFKKSRKSCVVAKGGK